MHSLGALTRVASESSQLRRNAVSHEGRQRKQCSSSKERAFPMVSPEAEAKR
jgi:hypothetical protein